MARTAAATGMLLTAAALITAVRAGKQWTYYGEAGPDQWPTLGFPQCSGERQSPINVVTNRVVVTQLPPFTFRHFDQAPLTLTLANNHHSASAEMTWERTPVVEDGGLEGKYEVINFHFHWGQDDFKGSEHTIDGESYPLEMHIVCKNTKYDNVTSAVTHHDGLAVLGVMYETSDWDGRALRTLQTALSSITAGGASTQVARPPRLQNLLPWNTREFFRYRGSLTTPGCHQAVTWTVFAQPMQVTASQLQLFRALRGGPAPIGSNFRPPQQRHGRTVLFSTDSAPTHKHLHYHGVEEGPVLEAVRGRSGAGQPHQSITLMMVMVVMMTMVAVGGRRDV